MDTTIYLNNAASSYPRPLSVNEAIVEYLNRPPYHPGRAGLDEASGDVLGSCRTGLARLFNAGDPNSIVLNSGATESLNVVLESLLADGGHVVTTAIEHNSCLRPLYRLAAEKGIGLTIVDCTPDGQVDPAECAAAVRDDTNVIAVNHCSNVTGAVQDLRTFAEIAHAAGAVLVVDASQSAGLHPIDVAGANIDILVFAGHKYLYGLSGTGGFYLSPQIQLRPLQVGGTGVRTDLTEQPPQRPILYESGTANMIGLAALNAGVQYVLEEGVDRLRQRIYALVCRLYQRLIEQEDVTVHAQGLGGDSSILSFNIEGMPPDDTAYLLENLFGFTTRSGLHCAPLVHRHVYGEPAGCVRISPSVFNTEEDIDQVADAIAQVTQKATCAL